MGNFERCQAALAILEKLVKKAKVLPQAEYARPVGALLHQEMRDCLEVAFYPGEKDTLSRVLEETTNAELYSLLCEFFEQSGE